MPNSKLDKKPARRPIGRPTKFSQELADELCAELSMGKSLRTVCESDRMPSTVTVFTWLRTYPDFLSQYTRAKEESADAMADEVLDIADDGRNDWMIRKYGQDTAWVENGEAINRSRLRVETRKWLMAKMKPKKYGQKLEVDGNQNVTGSLSVNLISYKDADTSE